MSGEQVMDLTPWSGIVKGKVPGQRFGFIVATSPHQEADVFFHANTCRGGDATFDALESGDAVYFLTMNTEKGLKAIGVEPIRIGATPTGEVVK